LNGIKIINKAKFIFNIQKYNYYIYTILSSWIVLGIHTSSQIILTPLYLSSIGEYEFGIFGIMMTVFNLCGAGVGWFIGPYNRILQKNNNRKRLSNIVAAGRIFFLGYILVIAIISLIVVLILRANNFSRAMFDPDILILYYIFMIISYYFIAERLLLNHINKQVLGNILDGAKIVVFSFIIYFYINSFNSLKFVMLALIISVLVQILALRYSINTHKIFYILSVKNFKKYLKIIIKDNSFKYGIYNAINVFNQMDILIVGYIGGGVEASKYILIMKIPELLITILSRIPNSLEPKIIKYTLTNNKIILHSMQKKYFKFYAVICLIICFLYSTFILNLNDLWIGSYLDFDQSIFNILAVVIFFGSLNKWVLTFMIGAGRVSEVIKLNTLECLLKISITSIAFINHGLVGVIYTSLIMNIIFYVIYNTLYLRKKNV